MAKSKKPKRSPVRGSRKQGKPRSRPKIKKDSAKEYRECIKSNKIAEVISLAHDDCLANVPMHVSTQSLALDRLLNNLGIPSGRVIEIFGPEHIGKSTLLDHIFAAVQAMGGEAILAEPEGARDTAYTRNIGVDPAKLHYLNFPREGLYLENILMTFYKTIDFWRAKFPDTPVVLGLDALGGAATREEMDKQLSEPNQPGAAAKVLREAARQIPARLGNTKISIVICNHEYDKINMGGYASKKRETYGGGGLRHLSSIRLSLYSGGEWIKASDGAILGRVVVAKLVKNRLGNPWGEARFALLSGVGVNNVWTIFERLKSADLITKGGSWSSLNLDGKILKFQGWTGLQQKCAEDPTLFPRLVSVYKAMP